MKDSFNRLTPAESERLAMLAEEAGEIVQIVGKILRHGYESYHPKRPTLCNRELLNCEIRDLMAVHVLMMASDDLPEMPAEGISRTLDRKMKYTHHQGDY